MTILGIILYCIIAAVCAWIADYLTPGTVPGGFLTAAVVGVIGAWIGTSLIGGFGPVLAGVPLLPAIVGSALLMFVLYVVGRGFRRA